MAIAIAAIAATLIRPLDTLGAYTWPCGGRNERRDLNQHRSTTRSPRSSRIATTAEIGPAVNEHDVSAWQRCERERDLGGVGSATADDVVQDTSIALSTRHRSTAPPGARAGDVQRCA
jgi:hypothetical protein